MAIDQGRRKSRQSFFLDQVLSEFSLASCACELVFPEPTFRFNEQGIIEEICGDTETEGFSKKCRVHLCEIPDVSPEFTMISQEADDDNKIYLNVILNGLFEGNLTFVRKTAIKHEFQRKVGVKWRKFLLQYSKKRLSTQFVTTLENHLNKLKTTENKHSTFLLLAVPPAVTRTSVLNRLNRNSATSDQFESETESESDTENNSSAAEEEKDLESAKEQEVFKTENTRPGSDNNSGQENKALPSLTPPFDLAPFSPFYSAYPPAFPKYGDLDTVPVNDDEEEDVAKKTTHDSLTDSLTIHSNELPQSLNSVLRSVYRAEREEIQKQLNSEGAAKKPSPDRTCDTTVPNEVLNSEFLPSDQLYIPMGMHTRETMEDKPSSQSPVVEEVEKLAHLLQTAINDREVSHAQDYAKQLTLKNVVVGISAKPRSTEVEEKHKEFNLKVYIEDKETSGASIILKVKSTDTIRDLKNRMLMKHGFPVEVQSWIVGQRIPADSQTLAQCRIKSDGHSVYLYLVSAKSVGLTNREDSLPQRHGMGPLTIAVETPSVADKPVIKREVSSGSSQSGSRQASMATPGSAAVKAGGGLDPNLNINRQEKKHSPASKLPTPHSIQEESRPVQVAMVTPVGTTPGQLAPNIPPTAAGGLLGLGGGSRVPAEHNESPPGEEVQGWSCKVCTFINQPTRPGCEICSNPRPEDYVVPPTYVMSEEEKQRVENEKRIELRTHEEEERQHAERRRQQMRNYQFLQQADAQDIIPNTEEFACPICFDDFEKGDGVVLRECLHTFCRDCLRDAVLYNEEPVLKCPYQDDSYSCDGTLQDREIKAVVTPEIYEKYLARSLSTAESQAANSFHCKTADCPGWCIYEDHVNFFVCPVCRKENCLTCKAIHQGMNCKEYQEDLKIRARNDGAANQTQIMINMMLKDGDAMACPQCQVIVMKKEGCDWIQCSICKTEICWVTKGARWGPLGNGDVSGGCRCRVNGQMCHPNCNNCH